jgi:CIC family chloride channel protein
MLGTAFGTAAQTLLPGMTAPPGAYGLVGMAAVFAGAARAPITSVIILFELTGDYRIILPLMVAVGISTLISEALSRDTIYTLKLRRRGIDLRAGKDVDLMRAIKVSQAMTTEVTSAPGALTVAEAAERLEHTGERALVVVDDTGAMNGIVTIPDIQRVLLENRPGATLDEIASRPVRTAFPDEPLSQAVQRMGVRDLGQVPVVERSDHSKVLGMLRRADIVRAYSRAMMDRLETQQQRPVLPRELRGTQIVEMTVMPSGPMARRRLAELRLPPDSLVIAVERERQTVIPRGDTQLLPDDHVLFLVRKDAVNTLLEQLGRPIPKATVP